MSQTPSPQPHDLQPQTEVALKQIRSRLRTRMDGAIAAQMRNLGDPHAIIWGITLPHLEELAQEQQPSQELAEALWGTRVRELRILATMLYPATSFGEEQAERWATECNTIELQRELARNLMSNSLGGEEWAYRQIRADFDVLRAIPLVVALHTVAHLQRRKLVPTDIAPRVVVLIAQFVRTHAEESAEQIFTYELVQSANELLKKLSRSPQEYSQISSTLRALPKQLQQHPVMQEVEAATSFEYQFFHSPTSL